jgi:hypothetical protein
MTGVQIQNYYTNTFDKEITGFLKNAVKSPSSDEDDIYEEFSNSMEPVNKRIIKAKKDAGIDYDLVSNIMMLLESTIILNPRISKKRKFFIMKCFQFYNEIQLKKKRTRLENAQKMFMTDLYNSLEQDIVSQRLFNQEYEKSILEERITPGLLELLNTRLHNKELVTDFTAHQEYSPKVQDWNPLLNMRHHNKELVTDFMAHQEYSPKVQDWMKQDSADIAASQYAATLFDDPSKLPPPNSLMNEVDGGRRKSKKKQHHKKYKSRAKSGAKSRAKSRAKSGAKSRAIYNRKQTK